MAQEPIDLAEYRKRREKKQRGLFGAENRLGPGEVPCPRCKQPVSGKASRCSHCGVHFSGVAADFAPGRFWDKPWVKVVLAVLIAVLIIAAFQDWRGI